MLDAETLILLVMLHFFGLGVAETLGFELPLTKGARFIDAMWSALSSTRVRLKQLGDVRSLTVFLWLVSGPSTQPWEALDALDAMRQSTEDAYAESGAHPEDPVTQHLGLFSGNPLLTKFFRRLMRR